MAYKPPKRRRRVKLLTDSKQGVALHFAACGNAPRREKQPARCSVFGQGGKDGKWRDEFERTANHRTPRKPGAVAVPFKELISSIGDRPAPVLTSGE